MMESRNGVKPNGMFPETIAANGKMWERDHSMVVKEFEF